MNSAKKAGHVRENHSVLARVEKKTLIWIAERLPLWINSDHLSLLGLTVMVAATSAPAAALGLDEIGMNTAGKSADFIVLNADPLDDIATMMQIDRVFLKGAEVGRALLRAGWTGQ